MRFASLGSGSRGNALLVEAGNTRVLIDAGFGPRETARRLERLGIATSQVDSVLVTHEHSDHLGGAFACARRFGWSILMTHGTHAASRDDGSEVPVTLIDSHEPFAIGDISVQPWRRGCPGSKQNRNALWRRLSPVIFPRLPIRWPSG